ncbi:phage tail protein [Pseudomonas carnis]|uniref:phage tail assembly chaperone n=1 Tax=Pseudomonas carnis TaxID=2487355 RepID=UPI0018E5DD18|nr:phage tail assembly chaperone [Pseudomonas carnis]MBI6657272.1 phage tail protein [Pseudomonas carnis]MBI6660452.1 phage tail protein [Pseudomonas carnis]MBI6686573.1 phage tail protein [Pseudomonas carnis]
MLYYARTTGGFYDDEVHQSIPADAVKITQDQRAALLIGEAAGRKISSDTKGFPVLVNREPPSDEILIAQARQWRDTEIDSLNWLRERHRDEVDAGRTTTLTAAQFGELIDYIQQLRDWPASGGFPKTDARPAAPAWIAEQTR